MALATHITTLRPRKAGCVTVFRISQTKQEQARRLATMADVELQHGHHAAAERLSHAAQAIREAGQ